MVMNKKLNQLKSTVHAIARAALPASPAKARCRSFVGKRGVAVSHGGRRRGKADLFHIRY